MTGVVSLNGTALAIGTVLFISDGGQVASAEIGKTGEYSLKCPPGSYHVAISPPAEPDPFAPKDAPGPAPSEAMTLAKKVPRRYQDVSSSGLLLNVGQGQNQFDIQLKNP